MKQQEFAELILAAIEKQDFALWYQNTFIPLTRGEVPRVDRAGVLRDITKIFNLPQDKETKVSTADCDIDIVANIDEMNDIGIVLDDGRQLTYHEIGSILLQLARNIRQLPFSKTRAVSATFDDVKEQFTAVGNILLDLDSE